MKGQIAAGVDSAGNRVDIGMVGDAPKSHVTNHPVEIRSLRDFDSFTITGIGATVQINNLDLFDEFEFDITGAGVTDTISISSSTDGTTFGAALLCHDLTTGNDALSVNMAVGSYVVPINCTSILVTMSGATDTHTFSWSARNANRDRMD
jgi:hypothetical protein